MKIWIAIACIMLMTQNVIASEVGKALAKSNVSRLELLANNLNMLSLISKTQQDKNKKPPANEIENTLTKFSISNNQRLMIDDFYMAPVAKVTNKQCNELLEKISAEVTGNNSTLGKALSVVSAVSLTPEQAQEVTNEAYLAIHIQAQENPQLSLSCNK